MTLEQIAEYLEAMIRKVKREANAEKAHAADGKALGGSNSE